MAYAPSEDELRARLTRARSLDRVDIRPYDFARWREDAERARQRTIEACSSGGKPIFQSDLWRQLKLHLFDLFHGKCAYCELAPLDVASGDVEHFRPKKGVAGDAEHRGYYWLAYEPENLLPCCEQCNRLRGKMTQFPIAGTRTAEPGSLDDELPLLLNPQIDDPRPHLCFTDQGTVSGWTERGTRSADVYNLNRGGLVTKRRAVLGALEQQINVAVGRHDVTAAWEGTRAFLERGECELSAAQLDQLDRLAKKWIEKIEASLRPRGQASPEATPTGTPSHLDGL